MEATTVQLNSAQLNELADMIATKLNSNKSTDSLPKTLNFEEFTKRYGRGHGRDWVKYYLLDIPEVQTFMSKRRGKGYPLRCLDVAKADRFFIENGDKIDWNAPSPQWLKAHMKIK